MCQYPRYGCILGPPQAILAYIQRGRPTKNEEQRLAQLDRALERLRKQHLWGDISDEDYREERRKLDLERSRCSAHLATPAMVNMEKAAQLLGDINELWHHPGVTLEKRKEFLSEVFCEIKIRAKDITSITPKPQYLPLFAYAVHSGRYGRGERI